MINMRLFHISMPSMILFLMLLMHTTSAHALELSFAPSSISGTGTFPLAVVAADFNGDGTADLAVLSSGSVIRMIGNGDGTFQSGSTIYSGSNLIGMASADLAALIGISGTPSFVVGMSKGDMVEGVKLVGATIFRV